MTRSFRLTDYVGLWRTLMRLSFRKQRLLSSIVVGLRLVGVFTFAATGVALRTVIDASHRGLLVGAVAGALGAAVAYATDYIVTTMSLNLRILAVERVALTELDASIVRSICEIEGLDHLESPEYLDRVTILRGAAWGVMDWAWAIIESVLNIARLGIALAVLGTVDIWLLPLLAFAAAPIWLDQRGRSAIRTTERATAEDVRLHRHLFDMLTQAGPGKEVRVAQAAEALIDRQKRAWNTAHRLRFRAQLVSAAWKALGWLVFTAGLAGAVGYVVLSAVRGGNSAGDVALAITIATNLRMAVQRTVMRAGETAGYGRLLEPYLWLRDYAARHGRLSTGELPAPDVLREGITLEHVSFTYPGNKRKALDDVTVRIAAGSTVAIVGEYGSGKTTLVKLLGKFYRPDTGSILVDGVDVAEIATRDWRDRISAAFQDFGRYRIKFGDSVGLGDPPAIEDLNRISDAVIRADAAGIVARLPDGLSTQLGREFGGHELSEGQWQKVALARSCMREEPLLFVLDEPTASLDAPSEQAIFDHYSQQARELAKRNGAITIIVSHRFSTVTGADLILVMESGRLIEIGSHLELCMRGGRYAELFATAAAGYSTADSQ